MNGVMCSIAFLFCDKRTEKITSKWAKGLILALTVRGPSSRDLSPLLSHMWHNTAIRADEYDFKKLLAL